MTKTTIPVIIALIIIGSGILGFSISNTVNTVSAALEPECTTVCRLQLDIDLRNCAAPGDELPRSVSGPETLGVPIPPEEGSCEDEAFAKFERCILSCEPVRVILVEIDIKPGSDPSSVNCKNLKGNVPVAIFTDDNFDATTIEIELVSMSLVGSNPISVSEVHDVLHPEDVDGDGDLDAVLHLDKAEVCEATDGAPLKESVDVTLTGSTTDGLPFEGTGDIRIVK